MKNKKYLSFLLILTMVFSTLSGIGSPLTAFAEEGAEPSLNENGYYEISNADELYWFAEKVNSGEGTINATLTADITVNENVIVDGKLAEDTSLFKAWTPIGTKDNSYGGNFDGQGHTVSGLYVNGTDDYIGFFGRIINDSEITGLSVANSYLKGGDNYVGGIVGYKVKGQISDCKSLNNIISGNYYVSGIIGLNNNGDIVNCYNSSAVNGSNNIVSGIVGTSYCNSNCKIKNCINIGAINGNASVGGIVGENYRNTYIENCYNGGEISGSNDIGGICGYNTGELNGSYNTGSVSATEYYAGGIVGYNRIIINSVYSVGKVTANESAGGVAGYNEYNIYNSYYDKTVSDIEAVGEIEDSNRTIEAYGKESDSFKSGEVAYLLSLNEAGSAFGQDLEKGEELPSFSKKRVYKACSGDVYTNNIDEVKHSYNEKGICENCGDYQEPQFENDSYQISNVGNLYWFAKRVNNGATTINATITDDIVINENVIVNGELNADTTSFLEWIPIGNKYNRFSGKFDGQGHFISGLYVASDEDYIGLIGRVDNSSICNVNIKNSYIKGSDCVGGIVGYIDNDDCEIKNCNAEGIIIGKIYVGGIAGYGDTNIMECSNSASVKGNEYVGGIVGYSYNITDCYNLGDVEGTSKVGGVVGASGYVKQIYNIGKVSGSEDVGGLIGILYRGGSINNGYFNSDKYSGEAVGYYDAANSTVGDDVLGKASKSFKNGEVAYLLNKDNSSAFGQDLAIDLFPVLNGPKVYMKENKNCDGSSKDPIAYLFSNDESLTDIIDEHSIKDWTCEKCNAKIGELSADTNVSGYADEDIVISGSAISYGIVEGDITYQWLKENENGLLEKIEGATESTYTVPKEVGTNKYYLSAKIGEYEKIAEATVVNVKAVPFMIGETRVEKTDKVIISFELLKNDDIVPSYQWYEEINGEFVKIENANSKSYEIPEGKAKSNYKCLVSFGDYSRFSDVITDGSEKYTVSVKSNNTDLGTAVASESNVYSGKEVSLKAEPLADYVSFLGWYDENGKLVSEELEYSFEVNKNISLMAAFRDNRRKVGDINNDSVVDMTDVNETLKKALNDDYVSVDKNFDFSYADVDNDGKITATDASLIRSMIGK